ncbi:hypothetical protein [Pseudarthrobacter sp. PS3-L1]|uniref:hypothetical protein n=1 Tax=Pseudarthrobacter sp. PS3-L1 TaxID=3046207 RepID=UPI0024B94D1D|nr:hypothetical protein [Pseudarthrobacter sp. PS3-L1]MDJ0322139.1 hypothetical protein [Pseudarthrobacter sp. PS3-L1]
MTVSQEAVEAAMAYLPHSTDCEVRPERECTCWKPRADLIRAALEDAAPFIAAQALEDAAAEMREERAGWCLDDAGRYWIKRTLDELAARAAGLRGQG